MVIYFSFFFLSFLSYLAHSDFLSLEDATGFSCSWTWGWMCCHWWGSRATRGRSEAMYMCEPILLWTTSLSLSIHPPTSLSSIIYHSICHLSLYPSNILSTCLSITYVLSIYLSIYPSICPSISFSVTTCSIVRNLVPTIHHLFFHLFNCCVQVLDFHEK